MLKILYQDSLGGIKEENQDDYLIKSFSNGDMLFAVSDGMGGGVMGAELSAKAIELVDMLFEEPTEYPLPKLKQSLHTIGDRLSMMLDGQKGGATLCIVYYTKCRIYYINIGDSRAWICRKGEPVNITLDQNIYEYKKLNNIYTDDEDKRFIYRILGISSGFEIEEILQSDKWSALGSFALQEDDVLLLSTDGFHDYIDTNHFCDDVEENFEKVLSHIKGTSSDNITAIIAKEVKS